MMGLRKRKYRLITWPQKQTQSLHLYPIPSIANAQRSASISRASLCIRFKIRGIYLIVKILHLRNNRHHICILFQLSIIRFRSLSKSNLFMSKILICSLIYKCSSYHCCWNIFLLVWFHAVLVLLYWLCLKFV